MEEAKKAIADGIAELKKTNKENELFPFSFSNFNNTMSRYFPYDFQREELKNATKISDVQNWAKSLKWDSYYKPSDAYFRKVNCVYRFFQDRLHGKRRRRGAGPLAGVLRKSKRGAHPRIFAEDLAARIIYRNFQK